MSHFNDYAQRFECIKMRREDGILEVRFHTHEDSFQWGLGPHREFEQAFLEISRDPENEVVILTGTGAVFSGPALPPGGHRHVKEPLTPQQWDAIYWEGKHLLGNLLNIEVPVISAINGPTTRHAEIPLLSDIVIAADTATIQDSAHMNGGLVPGDGVHVVFPALMGLNRGRYFLLTGQTLSAQQALDYGLISEILTPDKVLPRAWTLARQLLQRPRLIRRYARVLLTQDIKRKMHELLGYGLALEGLGACMAKE
jgi:enoyl-CoA hydratase/carnithine racemase